ncbi:MULTISPECIES: Ms4533A family Cys-rich leader peptide [Streptomyces]|nr:Ms4533A family Cys-rich leader peptide [Streptomyces sp. NRRL F-5135]
MSTRRAVLPGHTFLIELTLIGVTALCVADIHCR